jgi:hypothetical protein
MQDSFFESDVEFTRLESENRSVAEVCPSFSRTWLGNFFFSAVSVATLSFCLFDATDVAVRQDLFQPTHSLAITSDHLPAVGDDQALRDLAVLTAQTGDMLARIRSGVVHPDLMSLVGLAQEIEVASLKKKIDLDKEAHSLARLITL